MSIIDDVKEFLTESVTHRPLTGRDQYGKPTYGAGTAYDARVIRKHKLVRDQNGDEVVATAEIWLRGVPSIDPDDQIELPDGSTPHLASTEKYTDEGGDAFVKVFLR